MSSATADDLAGIPLFDSLEPDERAAIAPWFELQEVSAGVNLTGEGASGYSFFVLRDGTATVTIDGERGADARRRRLLRRARDPRRRAAHRDRHDQLASQVLVLFGTEFRRLQQDYPEIAAQIESALREIAASRVAPDALR